jgi:hypothetical protein
VKKTLLDAVNRDQIKRNATLTMDCFVTVCRLLQTSQPLFEGTEWSEDGVADQWAMLARDLGQLADQFSKVSTEAGLLPTDWDRHVN